MEKVKTKAHFDWIDRDSTTNTHEKCYKYSTYAARADNKQSALVSDEEEYFTAPVH